MERPYRPLIGESARRRRIRSAALRFTYPLLRIILLPLHGLDVVAADRLKSQGPIVAVMNHCLHIEWFFIWHAAWPRFTRFTAEEANIRRPVGGLFNRLAGVIGIPDDNPMAIAPAVERCLEDGELILFFPEGVLRRHSRCPGDFMIGAAWFSCIHDVPLLPVAEILIRRPIGKLIPWWPLKVKIIAGDPLLPEKFRKPGERTRICAQRMMQEAENIIRKTIEEYTVT